MAPSKDEMLLIISLTPTLIQAGVGVHEPIRRPTVEMSTRVGRKPSLEAPTIQDYLVGPLLLEAEHSGVEMEIGFPISTGQNGMEVVDWIGLEALFRYVLHIGLYTPRPPLAHPVILSLPPNLPKLLLDEIHQLFFEKLLVPQLLVTSRPMVATIASGVNNGIVLDIGARGEGSEISIITESQLLESGTYRFNLDEGNLDDYISLLLIQEDPNLITTLFPHHNPSSEEIIAGLRFIITSLKEGNVIGFQSPLFRALAPTVGPQQEEGEFDVAKVMAEGKPKDKRKGKRKGVEEEEEDAVEINHPYVLEGPVIRIGPIRHRYLEPLFMPSLLNQLAPSTSLQASQLNLIEYEGKAISPAGVQEMMGLIAGQISDIELRTTVWGGVVVTSTGKVAANKAFAGALQPILAPYCNNLQSTLDVTSLPRVVKVPEYFSEYKERSGELASYLGSCIFAKLAAADQASKFFVLKPEYASNGPAAYRLLPKVN